LLYHFLFQLHLLNAPAAIHNIVNLFRPFLKKKLMHKVNTIAEVTKPCLTSVRVSAVDRFYKRYLIRTLRLELGLSPLFLLHFVCCFGESGEGR